MLVRGLSCGFELLRSASSYLGVIPSCYARCYADGRTARNRVGPINVWRASHTARRLWRLSDRVAWNPDRPDGAQRLIDFGLC